MCLFHVDGTGIHRWLWGQALDNRWDCVLGEMYQEKADTVRQGLFKWESKEEEGIRGTCN